MLVVIMTGITFLIILLLTRELDLDSPNVLGLLKIFCVGFIMLLLIICYLHNRVVEILRERQMKITDFFKKAFIGNALKKND